MIDDRSELPPPSDVLEALVKVTSSAEFEGAGRLKEFLTYVVTETLDGRGHMILGKRIAQDVYGRRAEHDSETANVEAASSFSPSLAMTEPSACLAILPVSRLRVS